MRHDGKLPRALCCQIVTHCLVVISRRTPARVFTHTNICRHLWLCALITLCEITTVTTAVWATPCFPGHLGHQLPITATAPSLSDTAAHNESPPRRARCLEALSSTHPSLPFFHLLCLSILSFPSTFSGYRCVCTCECVCACVDACGLLTDVAEVQGSLGHHRWVSGCWWGGWRGGCPCHCGVSPLQQRCHQQMEL